jgi:hypothetical protein
MDEPNPAEPDSSHAGRATSGGWLAWIGLCLVATATISLVAVHLPGRVKMVGLFAIGYGLLTGWIAFRLTSTFDLSRIPRRLCIAMVCALILVGQVGLGLESWRVQRTAERRKIAADTKRTTALAMIEMASASGDEKSRAAADEARQTIGGTVRTFPGYLRYRVSELGTGAECAAWAIWIGEIALSSAAGTWLFASLFESVGRGKASR